MSTDGDESPDPFEDLSPLGKFLVGMARTGTGFGLVAMLVLVGLPYMAFLGLRQFAALLSAHNLQPLLYIVIGAVVFLTAAFAYRLRCTYRLMYGLLEMLFGVLVSFFAAEALLTSADIEEVLSPQIMVPIVGGVYVCIRGLNNVEDGLLAKRQMPHTTRTQQLWWRIFHKPLTLKEEPLGVPATRTMSVSVLVAITAAVMLCILAFGTRLR
jgi:hypothetical protein